MVERIGILISGSGTTMGEIIRACQDQEIPNTEIGCIISSKDNTGGIEKAKKMGISEEDVVVIDPRDYKDELFFGKKINEELERRGVTFVTQNGWMPKTPENVVRKFESRIFNQHPAPVPEFGGKGMYGKRPHQAIIEFSRLTGRDDLWTEVIGQRVGVNYDQGVVVKSERIYFTLADNGESLQLKALPVEHQVQKRMIIDFVLGNLKEFYRSDLIVLPGQERFLEQAKEIAIKKYPHG